MERKITAIGCAIILLCAVLYLAAPAASREGESSSSQGSGAQAGEMAAGITYAMNTVIEQRWYGPAADTVCDGSEALIREVEAQLSMHLESSEIAKVNAQAGIAPVEVSERTFRLLQRAKQLSEESGGAFDSTIAPVVELWGITGDDPQVPSDEALAAAMELVGIDGLLLDEGARTAYLERPGMAIDLGGIAKGWTAGLVGELAHGQAGTAGFASLGGNLIVIGENPDGSGAFRFGLRDPQGDASQYLAIVELKDGETMATTGGYERYFEQDGVRYHHVIDPKTGYPAQSDLLSVTVITQDGALGDYLSTALFIEGKEAALARGQEEGFALILVDTEGNVYYSPSLADRFEPHDGAAAYRYFVIE